MFKKLLSIRISLLYLIAPLVIGLVLFVVLKNHTFFPGQNSATGSTAKISAEGTTIDCGEKTFRLKGFKYIKPLVNESRECESVRYAALKESIKNYIDAETKTGAISCASVFLKNLGKGEDWISVYPRLEYHPASLGKVPILITYLKKSESVPGLLDKEIFYVKDSKKVPSQNFAFDSLRSGHKYKVRELLYHMIANSDNRATLLLQDNIDFASFRTTITDLGFDENKLIDTNYKFKAREYSIFLEALYNAGYLNMPSSEYASSLLAQCKFREGVLKNLPADVKAIHKFGEYAADKDRELHESAIIYIDNNAYVITIMTKGHDFKKLSDLMGHISRMVYDYMNTSV